MTALEMAMELASVPISHPIIATLRSSHTLTFILFSTRYSFAIRRLWLSSALRLCRCCDSNERSEEKEMARC